MKIFKIIDDKNPAGHWRHYLLFGRKVYTKLIALYRYS